MKLNRWVFLIGLLMATLPLSAQSQFIPIVTVPFEFMVNDVVCPAGNYAIQSDAQNNMLVLTNASTQDRIQVFTRNYELLNMAEQSVLTFRRDGNTYVLHQVQRSGDSHTHDIAHDNHVMELAAIR